MDVFFVQDERFYELRNKGMVCILDFFVIDSMVVNNAMDPHFWSYIACIKMI